MTVIILCEYGRGAGCVYLGSFLLALDLSLGIMFRIVVTTVVRLLMWLV